MHTDQVEQVVGRRLDVNGGNLVLFRGAELNLNSKLSPKRSSDQDMLDYVRAQEQKMKLEKLKWQEMDARIAALHKGPPSTGNARPATKPAPPPKSKELSKRSKAPEPVARGEPPKRRPDPKYAAETIEQRNRKASEWLHKEQQESQARKAEILANKRAARELDRKRRQQEHEEAERRRMRQLQMLHEDPVIATAIPVELEAALSVPAVPLTAPASPPPMPSDEPVLVAGNSKGASAVSASGADTRVSHSTMAAINELAAQFQLPAPSETGLHLQAKRPGVPRLSKGYVSKAHLLASGAAEGAESVGEGVGTQARGDGPVLVPRRTAAAAAAAKKTADSDGSDGYGEDEDFEPAGPGDKDAVSAADTALVKKVLAGRYESRGVEERKRGDRRGGAGGGGDSSGDEGDSMAPSPDAITARTTEEARRRREEGRQYAMRRRHEAALQDAKRRQERAEEEKKRQHALKVLQKEVVAINKRTKHMTSTGVAGETRGSGSASHSGVPIRDMLTPTLYLGDDRDDGAPPSPLDKLLAQARDQLVEQGVDDSSFPVGDVYSLREPPRAVEAVKVRSPPRYAMEDAAQEPEQDILQRDLRNLHPSEAGGWSQFMRQERELAQQRQVANDSAPDRNAGTPPRTRTAGDGKSPQVGRNSASPPVVRRAPVAAEPTAIRKPSPPPFRFNSWQQPSNRSATIASAGGPAGVSVPAPRAAQSKVAGAGHHSSRGSGQQRPTTAGKKPSAATLRQARKPPLDSRPKTASSRHPQSGPTAGRSRSAGSTRLHQREWERAASGEPDNRPPTRARSAGRSRSVFETDAFDRDALDLFDRRHVGQSTDDEVQFGEPPGSDDEFEYGHGDAHEYTPAGIAQTMGQSTGFGGYLSKSPARGSGAAASRHPAARDVAAVWDEVPRVVQDAQSIEQQRLLQDVSEQSFRNFEQVTRVLQDVDRWCEQAKQETLQLKERLKMRESMEFTPSMGAVRHQHDAPTPAITVASPERVTKPLPTRSAAEVVFSPANEQDIAEIRNSLAGRLSSRAQELFDGASSPSHSVTSSSSEEEDYPSRAESTDQEQSVERKLSEGLTLPVTVPEPPTGAAPTTAAAEVSEARHSTGKSIEEWRRQNAAVRAKLGGGVTKVPPAVAPAKLIHPSREQGILERKLSQEEVDDSVLMGESVEVKSDEDSDLEDPYLAKMKAMIEGHRSAGLNSQDFVSLNTASADRPLLWKAGPDSSPAAFSAKDPLLAHQLGMAADRNAIIEKYAKLAGSVDRERSSASAGAVGSPSRYRYSDDSGAASETEDWTKPTTRPPPVPAQRPPVSSKHLPSLRNVGELAGLLRSTYRAELETEAGRSALLDATDSDDSDSADDSSEIGADYDNYSAVSIMAARIMAEQVRALKAKEKGLVGASGTSAAMTVDAATGTDASVESSAGVAEPSTVSLAEEEEKFWAETLVQPERQVSEGDVNVLDESGAVDDLLRDFGLDVRYGGHLRGPNSAEGAATGTSGVNEEQAPAKIRYSGAEMRVRMMEELRRQDELFSYTLELAELEKTHAMQQARDLAMQAQQRSAEELAALQQRQELEMQRLAYENSIALSLVTAQHAMEQQTAEQREQVMQLQSRLSAQDMFRQYQELLQQADRVAGNLDQNQKLLDMERLLQEDRAREVVAELENKHATEKAAMMLAHAEVQKAHAEALVEASRKSMEMMTVQQQEHRASIDAVLRASHESAMAVARGVHRATEREHPAAAASQRRSIDSEEEYEEDEYSEQFETEGSVSVRSRSALSDRRGPALQRRGVAGLADSDEESIPDVEEASRAGKSAEHSLEVSDSIAYSPANQRVLHQSMQSSQHSVSTASTSHHAPANRWQRQQQQQRGRYDASESEVSEVEDSVRYGDNDEVDEVPEESAYESRAESPLRASAKSVGSVATSAVGQSYSQSSRAFEVSDASHGQRAAGRSMRQSQSQSHSAVFEVGDSAASVHTESVASEVPEVQEESGSGEPDYSDTFEASESKEGSRGSGPASTISTTSRDARKDPVAQPRTLATNAPLFSAATTAATLNVRPPRSSIPALDSSTDSGAVLADSRIPQLLDGYRAEMEERLRAQEQTYKLKVQLLKAKQAQRLEWLAKVRQNRRVSGEDVAEEEQRIADAYAEERAQVERERWALNARAYKELRKFKRLRRDLLQYQVNVQNSAQAAAELEANLLELKNRRSVDSDLFAGRPGRDGARNKAPVSDSVTSSSDSAPAFAAPMTQRAVSAAVRPRAAPSVAPPRPVPPSETEEDEYADSDFEEAQSSAVESVPAQKPGQAQHFGEDSRASYSQTYETSAASPVSMPAGRDRSPSSASEVSEEESIAEEPLDNSAADSQAASAASASYQPTQRQEHQPLPPATTLDQSRYTEESQYSFEAEQSMESSPERKIDSLPEQRLPVAVPENEDDGYDSYGEDFVQESDHGSVGRPGLTAPQAVPSEKPAPATALSPPKQRSPSQKDDEASIESDIESEISAYGRESDGSDEPYYQSTSAAQVEGSQLLAPIPPTAETAEAEEGPHTFPVSVEPSKSPGDEENAEVDEDYSESEFSAALADDTSPLKPAPQSPSLPQRGAGEGAELIGASDTVNPAVQDEHVDESPALDETRYDDEDFPEYQSEEESSPEPIKAVAPTAAAKTESADLSEDEESIPESVATSIAEDEEEARVDQSARSEGSEDYLATSRGAAGGDQHDGPVEEAPVGATIPSVTVEVVKSPVPPPTEVASPTLSPMKVTKSSSGDSASTRLSVQTITPTRPGGADEGHDGAAGRDPDVEFWGSEDFLESPAILNKKTALILQQQQKQHFLSAYEDKTDATGNQMHFDPDEQRWVGGEDVSLDGFEESVDAAASQAAAKDRGDGSTSSVDLDDSGADDSRGSLSEHEPDKKANPAASAVAPGSAVRRGAGIAEHQADEYASDEFSGHHDEIEPSPVKSSPAKTAPEDAEEVPEEIDESIAEAYSSDSDEGEPSPQTRVPPATLAVVGKPDLSLALSEASFADDPEPTSASDLSGLLISTSTAAAGPLRSAASFKALEESTLEGSLGDLSADHVESPVAPKKPVAAAADDSAVDDSFLDSVLGDLSFEDAKLDLASEATEFGELEDYSADHVEVVRPVAAAATPAPAAAAPTVVAAEREGDRAEEEEENRLVLVDEVTDMLLDTLVRTECAAVLSLVPHVSRDAEPKARGRPAEPVAEKGKPSFDDGQAKPSAATPDAVVDEEEMLAADKLAENMMLHSSKFHRGEKDTKDPSVDPDAKPHHEESKGSLSSLGSLPSLPALVKKSLPPVGAKPAHTAHHDDSTGTAVERPAEFGAEDEDLYEFDIPTRVSGTGDPLVVGVGAVGPDGIVHPPHGTEGSAKEEPPAGAAILAAVRKTEALQDRCAMIVASTKTYLEETLSQPDLHLSDRLAAPAFEGRFVDAIPTPPEGSPAPVVVPGAVHAGAMNDRIDELCREIHTVKHGTRAGDTQALPLARRIMLQALPLREDAVKAHIQRVILAEQQALAQSLLATGGGTADIEGEGEGEVPVVVDMIDSYRGEAAREIELASHQMADALLARCLIEACADLADFIDLESLLGTRK